MAITITEITNQKVWEDFLKKNQDANFLQSWYWGQFHQELNHQIFRYGIFQGYQLKGVMLSIIENAKRGKYLTVPGGPIIDWNNQSQVDAFVQKIKDIAKAHSCVFVRVRPQLKSDDFSKTLFRKLGFKNAPMHLHAELTSQLDITPSQEQLLANMRKATRYEIKKALNLGITIETTTDEKSIRKFYDLQLQTAKRQKFVPFSLNFLSKQFKVFANQGKAILYSAKLQGKLLAQAFIIFYNFEAAYHYGASTDEGRKYPGAYLIQWAAIMEAQKRGIRKYNFWGVAPENDKNHRFYGLSLFKRGFGGVDFEYLHAQDLIINYPGYLINYAVETIRKKIRNV